MEQTLTELFTPLTNAESFAASAAELTTDLEGPSRSSAPPPSQDTFFNSLRINVETYGIFGYMIVNRYDIQVPPKDDLYVTSEPKNLAPLEFLTWYVNGGSNATLWAWDWGITSGNQVFFIGDLKDPGFYNNFFHEVQAPNGQSVHTIIYKNFFDFKLNRNCIHLMDKGGKWIERFRSSVTGIPAPPSSKESGWSAFEYKRFNPTSEPWATVPHPLGFFNTWLMDKKGNWYQPKPADTYIQEEAKHYMRVFANPAGAFYKG